MPSPETRNPEDVLSNIGELLVADGSITQEQLAKAERVLARLEVKERLSDVLLKLGYVGEPQLRAVMKKHKRSLSIGDFLVELKFIRDSRSSANSVFPPKPSNVTSTRSSNPRRASSSSPVPPAPGKPPPSIVPLTTATILPSKSSPPRIRSST